MTYYNSSDFKEQYYTEFKDILGGLWHVSIQKPSSETLTAVQLTASDNPLEWMGQGNEDQTKCVLGSTGTLRIKCLAGQESHFATGMILPSELNNRRVIITRDGVKMWQGFIKADQYSQSWDAAPYDVELSLVSALAMTEYITLPAYGSWGDEEPTNVADMLRFALSYVGCDFTNLLTNKPVYEDYEGGHQSGMHWTEGDVTVTYWYDWNETGAEPQTIKSVLETLLYPYGHVREYGTKLGVFMDNAGQITSDSIYALDLTGTATSFRMNKTSIDADSISTFDILSDDNNRSMLPSPNRINYSRSVPNNSSVFELKDTMIKNTYSPGATQYTKDFSDYKLYVDYISPTDIEQFQFKELSYDTQEQAIGTNIFARILCLKKKKAVGGTQVLGYDYNIVEGLGFSLVNESKVEFKTKNEVRTKSGFNKVKLTVKVYRPAKGADAETSDPMCKIKVKDNGKYLIGTGAWSAVEDYLNLKDLAKDGDGFSITFHENRSAGDTTPHKLHMWLKGGGNDTKFVVIPKVEYVEDDALDTGHINVKLADGTKCKEKYVNVGGTGDDIDVTFKTMCGEDYDATRGAANAPYNGFCDNPAYIYTGQREMLDIGNMRNTDQSKYFKLVQTFQYVYDGTKFYVPAAVGMNAREASMKVKLISIN